MEILYILIYYTDKTTIYRYRKRITMQQYRHERGSRRRPLFRNNSYATIALWYKTPHSTSIRNNTTADRKGVFDYRFFFHIIFQRPAFIFSKNPPRMKQKYTPFQVQFRPFSAASFLLLTAACLFSTFIVILFRVLKKHGCHFRSACRLCAKRIR